MIIWQGAVARAAGRAPAHCRRRWLMFIEARGARVASLIYLSLILSFALSPAQAQTFAKGADVSWMTQMEASGVRWLNDNGTQQDLLQILKDHGMNAIRLRVWVNPSGGWNGANDV